MYRISTPAKMPSSTITPLSGRRWISHLSSSALQMNAIAIHSSVIAMYSDR